MSTNWVKHQGDKFPCTLDNIQDDTGTVLTSLSGWSFFFTVKSVTDAANNDDAALISLSTSSGMSVSGGSVSWTVDTASLAIDTTYIWDVQSKSPAGNIYTETYGTLQIIRDVSRRTS